MSDDILKTAREVLDAEEANHPTPQSFVIGPAATRRRALMAATAPELARFVLLVDDMTAEYAKGPSLRASFARDLRRALGLPSSSLGESGSGEVGQ